MSEDRLIRIGQKMTAILVLATIIIFCLWQEQDRRFAERFGMTPAHMAAEVQR